MNVPASIPTSQNGITVQVRSSPHVEVDKANPWAWFVGPLTPVFKTRRYQQRAGAHRAKRYKTTFGASDGDDHITQVQGYWAGNVVNDDYSRANFVGVTAEGLPDGQTASKFRGGATHFTVISRGLVTIMCDYGEAKRLEVGDWVKVTPSKNSWNGIGVAPNTRPFALAKTHTPLIDGIGYVVDLPTRRVPSNEVIVLLC
jgi:hypothetical protein